MAICLSLKVGYPDSMLCIPQAHFRNHNFTSLPLRALPKSSDKSTELSKDFKPIPAPKRIRRPTGDLNPLPEPSFFHLLREWFKVDGLLLEIASIALPAALALAADPITALVDTAFVGHLGSPELAAVGVSASVFNLVSKMFNVPLLNVTTSFVAEDQAILSRETDDSAESGQVDYCKKKSLPSVSTSLALAGCIGVAETVALSVGSGFLMNIMGFSYEDSCTAIFNFAGLWSSSDSNSPCRTRHFSWVQGHKNSSLCNLCW